jgi:DNA polymerase III subunit alpha
MAPAFIRRYRGDEAIAYLHPSLASILGPTRGVLLFQEQILRIAHDIAGLSWAQADHLRRGMSKFQSGEMSSMQATFITGCLRPIPEGPAFTLEQAHTLWQQVAAFAGYGFNQGHATAYADISYRSAYLKTHWPAEFMAARLATWGGYYSQAIYITEARRLGIAVHPPHINQSKADFLLKSVDTVADRPAAHLWMGLGQIKELRNVTIDTLLSSRVHSGPFTSLHDFLSRVQVQRKELNHLIQCGALDSLAASRAALLQESEDLQGNLGLHQLAFTFATSNISPEPIVQRLQWEQRILGLPVSCHPLDALEAGAFPGHTVRSIKDAKASSGASLQLLGVRLPGWAGARSWILADRSNHLFAFCVKGLSVPRPWQPLLVSGRWREDEWGGGSFQVETCKTLAYPELGDASAETNLA